MQCGDKDRTIDSSASGVAPVTSPDGSQHQHRSVAVGSNRKHATLQEARRLVPGATSTRGVISNRLQSV